MTATTVLLSLFISIVVLEIGMTSGAAINANADDSLETLFDKVTHLDDDSPMEQTLA